MQRQLSVFLCAFLALQVASSEISPRDLVDEARDQLQNLKGIVQGEIFVAHDNLASSLTDFQTNSDNVEKSAAIDIQQEHLTVSGQIITLKDLAESAGVDATTCIDIRQQVIDRLPTEYTEEIVGCIGVLNTEAAQIVRDGTYVVDVVLNRVQSLEFQLNICGDQISCISTIVTQIQLDTIRLPQNIQTEVSAVQTLLNTLRLSVTSCSNTKVASYISEANSILSDIEACINRLIP